MYTRYAVFHTPPEGPLAEFGASWLGWDSARGKAAAHPQIDGVDVSSVTAAPRKYGLHATLKAPFRLINGADQIDLERAMAEFAATRAPVMLSQVALSDRFRFVALRPTADSRALCALAEEVVRAFDRFRAPLTDPEIARRVPARLSARQTEQLHGWGYPYVFDDFNFHITLTGSLSHSDAARVIAALAARVESLVPQPYPIDAVTLMGEDSEGLFHQIARYRLIGKA
ncbi:DUF1045 domain-containing protein [uncultured Sulfitobacter sp.]|uniref:DUF1045 domain-containing protein n=1 Tax=uncultured Sulfitobacter sp. TaxID=191468 RepID=UPI0026028BD4|nr:DUF1045 domain-containing protein [uncultured Sulfitobacter sp.]